MADKAYNAGTIFLQVVPVFKDIQREITQKSKEINKALADDAEKGGAEAGQRHSEAFGREIEKGAEKSGDKAGKKYAGAFLTQLRNNVRDAAKEIEPLKLRTDDAEAQAKLAALKKEMRSINRTKLKPDMDIDKLLRKVATVEAAIDAIDGEVDVEFNLQRMKGRLAQVKKMVESTKPVIEVEIDDRQLGAFERRAKAAAKSMAESLDKETSPAVARLKKRLEDATTLEVDATKAREEIAEVSRELKALANDGEMDFVIRADAGEAYKTAQRFNVYASELDGKHLDVTVDLNVREAERRMGAFETQMRRTFAKAGGNIGDGMSPALERLRGQMESLASTDITPDLDATHVEAEARRISAELSAIFRDKSIDIDARVDAASAFKDLAPLMIAVARLDGRQIDIQADVDAAGAIAQLGALNGAMAATEAHSAAMGGAVGLGANSFRSFNAVILAAALLLPALIPMIGALGGGLLALIPIFGAVGAGLGAMLVGFSGIPDALKAMSDVDKNAAKESLAAGKTMAGAARSVADAERGLANARRSAAQSNADAARAVADAERNAAKQIKDALKQQADAERNLAQAQRDSTQAQQDLREARKAAEQELIDAADRRKQNALDERQGVIDVFNATVANNAVQSDPGSTNLDKEKASIALEQAQLDLKNVRDEQKALADEKAKYDRDGIKGTDVYKSAQDKVIQALERQRDAERAVGQAAQEVRDARVNGARAVADAVRNQQRTEAAGAQSVADAQRGLARAQEDYQTALTQTGEIGSASMQKLEDAMGKLGPAGQHFARFLYSLRAGFQGIRADIQESMLPGVEAGLRSIIDTYGPQFRTFAADMGGVMGKLFRDAGQGLGAKPWQDFFATYAKLAPRLLGEFGQTTGNWMNVYARLFTIVAPYAERLSLALLEISQRADRWMQSADGTKFWTDFMNYAARVGPEVLDFFVNLWGALVNIAVALAPLGELTMNIISGFLGWVAALPPKWLAFILGAILSMVIAFQILVGAIAATFAGAIVAASGLTLIPFALMAIAGAAVSAYLAFGGFSGLFDEMKKRLDDMGWAMKIVTGILGTLAAGWVAYHTYLLLVTAAQWAQTAALGATSKTLYRLQTAQKAMNALLVRTRVLTLLSAAATWASNAALLANPITWIILAIIAFIAVLVLAYYKVGWFRDLVDGAWKMIGDGVSWLWNDVLKPTFSAIGAALTWLWTAIFQPVFAAIWGAVSGTFNAIAWIWKGILWPVLDLIMTVIWKLWVSYFKFVFGAISLAFQVMVAVIKAVWNAVFWPLISLIGSFIGAWYRTSIKPIFDLIGWLWGKVVNGMKWVWEHILHPMFSAFGTALGTLQGVFSDTVDNIGRLWDGLRAIIAAPIRFVIEDVLNKGLIKAFNWVAKKVGSDPMSEIPLPGFAKSSSTPKATTGKGHKPGISQAMATGGVLPGYTPGRDPHEFYSPTGGRLKLSGGEAVMRPEFTAGVGRGFVDEMNRVAMTEGVAGIRKRFREQAFSGGGIINANPASKKKKVVWPVPGHETGTYPGHNGVDINRGSGSDDLGDPIWAFRDGTITYVGSGRGYGNAIMENGPGYPEVVYGHTSAQYVHSGQQVTAGTLIGRVGSTGNSTAPHLHFGLVHGGTTANALALLKGADMSGLPDGGFSIPGWVGDLLKGPAKWVLGKITGPLKALREKFGDNELVDATVGTAKKLINPVGAKLKDMAEGFKNKLMSAASAVGNFVGGIIPGGSDEVKDEVRAVAAKYGWDKGSEWDALDWVISHESGWNPNADNPSSSAAGLFQKMTSIHGALENTVAGQAKWGLNYIKDRYGDPLGAKRHWQQNGNYAEGGVLPTKLGSTGHADNGTMMYDNGGYLPPGLTTVLNLTGKPEPVFTADQFSQMRGGGDGSGVHYEPHFYNSDLTAQDVAFDFDVKFRQLSRVGSRYAGKQG
jgi:murein DD-endopeptidase MepM/ murein hydrolase activator NlpD